MSEIANKIQAFKLKGRLYTFTVLQILTTELDLVKKQLEDSVAQAPKMFVNTPVVLELAEVYEHIDFSSLCRIVREQGLIPVAVQGVSGLGETLAQAEGLAVLNASAVRDKTVADKVELAPAKAMAKTKIITSPVRSGQQIIAKGCDLIITASVSHGAELLADGNIHVYGSLRGRALAGMSGDTEARIFCQSLDAELVSIAGYYSLSDAMSPVAGPCQIGLKEEQIDIQPL